MALLKSGGATAGSAGSSGDTAAVTPQPQSGVQGRRVLADMRGMSTYSSAVLVFLAFVVAILYIMRRRTRQGRRTPKF